MGAYAVSAALPTVRPPAERLAEALETMDAHPPPLDPTDGEEAEDLSARRRAAALALPLIRPEAKGVTPGPPPILPHVPGAAAYIVGLEAFGRAAESGGEYDSAAAYLVRAEREGVPPPRRRTLLIASGLSLLRAGRPTMAFDRFAQALREEYGAEAAGAVPLWQGLVDSAVRDGRPDTLEEAAARLAAVKAPANQDSAAALLRARGRLAVERNDPATASAALAGLQQLGARGGDLAVRLALLMDDMASARAALPPVPRFPLLGDLHALYMHGRVEEASGDRLLALARYRAAAELAPRSADGLSARLAEARLLTAAGRFEEASEALRLAVDAGADAQGGTAGDLRAELRQACEQAVRTAAADPRGAEHCVALCETVESALGAPLARRLKAEVLDAAATNVAGAFAAGEAYAAWAAVEPDRDLRRFARLAAVRHLRRAGRPAAALAELDQIPMVSDPDPGGLRLERARLLMDLGRAADARTAAQSLVQDLPSDPAAPPARVLIGSAALEAGDPDGAIAAWTAVLSDTELTPAAAEWRESLFARADLTARRALAAAPPIAAPDAREGDAADAGLSHAVDLLGECLARYPNEPAAVGARLERARCRLARWQRLDAAPLPTDSLNLKRRQERAAADLIAALADFRTVSGQLRGANADTAPAAADVVRLRLARLGAAECLTRLGRTEAGGVAVAQEVDRDPLNPRSVAALLDLAAARRAVGDEVGGRLAVEQARLTIARLPDSDLAAGRSPLSRAEWNRLFLLARRAADEDAAALPPPPRQDAP
ncbi:hypothetical protein [Alienimonas californiensis]|uniref:hypothetical protein n=1 Tax=Alienimonas californiensis TaxID=2527989 RepID=UPI0013FCF819|nr:hypothetical protein [Alienimonas californiensis]